MCERKVSTNLSLNELLRGVRKYRGLYDKRHNEKVML